MRGGIDTESLKTWPTAARAKPTIIARTRSMRYPPRKTHTGLRPRSASSAAKGLAAASSASSKPGSATEKLDRHRAHLMPRRDGDLHEQLVFDQRQQVEVACRHQHILVGRLVLERRRLLVGHETECAIDRQRHLDRCQATLADEGQGRRDAQVKPGRKGTVAAGAAFAGRFPGHTGVGGGLGQFGAQPLEIRHRRFPGQGVRRGRKGVHVDP